MCVLLEEWPAAGGMRTHPRPCCYTHHAHACMLAILPSRDAAIRPGRDMQICRPTRVANENPWPTPYTLLLQSRRLPVPRSRIRIAFISAMVPPCICRAGIGTIHGMNGKRICRAIGRGWLLYTRCLKPLLVKGVRSGYHNDKSCEQWWGVGRGAQVVSCGGCCRDRCWRERRHASTRCARASSRMQSPLSWLPTVNQPGRALCRRPNSSTLRPCGHRRSIMLYSSSGLRDVSRTSATMTSVSSPAFAHDGSSVLRGMPGACEAGYVTLSAASGETRLPASLSAFPFALVLTPTRQCS